ncbi:MAG TPA: NAD-dependent succinate-semialdehyde dehydrogenase [Alphaproteobacteria bacterium]|nr:NAD-dependent succinate-semialdehyde dehydrogenase [Alphaproteobacteria bacterium]
MSFKSINPATGATLTTYPEMDLKETLRHVNESHTIFTTWRRTPFNLRAMCMKKASDKLIKNKESLALLITQEMGKPLLQAQAEIEKCAWLCDYFAENSESFLKSETVKTEADKSYIAYEPLGVVLAIMPWNFPFWQAFRAAVPALMAGNSIVLKHASNVPGCALAIETIFKEAGFPEGLFRTLLITSTTALALIESAHIRGVTLTGSAAAGQSVGTKAGQFLKKCVLELGGSDPYIILEDANLEEAATICTNSRLMNSGQSCIAAKRFIILEEQRERFEKLIVERMKNAILGDPLEAKTTVGPLARIDLRDTLHSQVLKSMEKGAICLLGGEIPEGPGTFYPPTVLTNVTKGMPAYDEELFGPVAAILVAKNEQIALQMANDTIYGLGAAVFTQDLSRGERIALKELNAGSCFVNAQVKSDPRLPFGGIKESGFGRELSHLGIKEFVNCKTLFIKAHN